MYLFTTCSKHFMARDVGATDLKSFGTKGLGNFGTGTVTDTFQIFGIVWLLKENQTKKIEKYFQILPQTLSGSELFGGLQPPKTCNTFDSVIKSKGGVGEDGNSTGQSFLLPLSKQQKRVFSWLAISRPSLTCRLREAFPLPWCGTFIMGLILCHASLELLDVSQHPLTFDCTFNLSLEVTSGYVTRVFKSLFLHLHNLYKFWMGPLNSHRNVYNQSPVWYSH